MTDQTQPTQGAKLLADLSDRADALADAVEDFGGDDLLAQATDLANRVAIAKAVLLPLLPAEAEPLKVRAIDWKWARLDECHEDDIVWHDGNAEWSEVDLAYAGFGVAYLNLGSGARIEGKPSDVVRVADQALALAVDGALDDLHDREADRLEREAV